MYVFVDIAFDLEHLVDCIQHNFRQEQTIALAGTIQFTTSVVQVKARLAAAYPHMGIPQVKPLSGGEVLGCTAPTLPADTDALVFVADGRFHLESIMIANPTVPAFRCVHRSFYSCRLSGGGTCQGVPASLWKG